MRDETPLGSFVSWHVVDGVRYEVFGRYRDGGSDCFERYNVYDEAGNRVSESFTLRAPRSEQTIRRVARFWHAQRTATIVPCQARERASGSESAARATARAATSRRNDRRDAPGR